MKKRIGLLFSLILVILMVIPVYAQPVEMNYKKAVLSVGDVLDLDITDADASPVWTSYNPNIARVDQNGVVTAICVGKTTVRARVGAAYQTCDINVVASSLKLNTSSATIYHGGSSVDSVQLKATTKGAGNTVSWNSSDESVATVDANGKVTSVSAGQAVITASANHVTAQCNITVLESAISLNISDLQLSTKGVGSSMVVTPTVVGSKKNVTWTTSDKNVATVKSGKITGKQSGTATITAVANGVSATCQVTVLAGSISIGDEKIVLYADNPTVDSRVLKTNAGKKDIVSWSSSDETVATVDAKGKVTAVGPGEAYVQASCYDTVDRCQVTVYTTATDIGEERVSLRTKGVDKTYVLSNSIIGKSTRQTWKSDNIAVVKVSKGKLTAVKPGVANVTLTANGKSDTVVVTVSDYEPTISLNQSRYTLYTVAGNTLNLKATVDGPSKVISWSSSNDSVASVVSGKITAMNPGEATIIAEANGVSATCLIEVLESRITLTDYSLNMDKGESASIGYDICGNTQSISWTSTNPKLVTVKNGLITAVNYGEADIRVSANGVSAVCHVNVSKCDHNYKGYVQQEANCQHNGILQYRCDKCGDSYTEEIPFEGTHSFDILIYQEPTCTDSGCRYYICSICNASSEPEEIPARGHEMEWRTVEEPQEGVNGLEAGTCKTCGYRLTNIIPALIHEHDYQVEVIEPTCTVNGYKELRCRCGSNYRVASIPATGHDFYTEIIKESTCGEYGREEKKCRNCIYWESYPLPLLTEHQSSDWVVLQEPTCYDSGRWEKRCLVCNTRLDYKIIDGHHEYETFIDEPTCTQGGETYYVCKVCDRVYRNHINTTSALGHDYAWQPTVETACGVEEEALTCKRCNYVNETRKHVVDHYFIVEEVEQAPTFDAYGYASVICTKCDVEKEHYKYWVLQSEIDEREQAIVDAEIEDDMTDEEKYCALYTWVTNHVVYHDDTFLFHKGKESVIPLLDSGQTSASALVFGTTVCAGFADLYDELCQLIGLECQYMSSFQLNHAWNRILIDGEWYWVDATWDSPDPDYGEREGTYHYWKREGVRVDDETIVTYRSFPYY